MSAAPRPLKPGDHVFLVDGSSFVFRAYFQSINQDRKYNFRSDRLPTGAVRLFCTKLFQFIRDGAVGIKPTHLAIIFDKSEESFRKELYPAYKANRSDPPEELIPQFPLMREAVKAFGLIPVEMARYEADDLIATYARQAAEAGADVLVVSADKDLMQIVGERVAMYDPASGEAGGRGARPERRIGLPEVLEYFGVPPEKVTDVQALAGDSTDNVPGVPGIGIKTAATLIQEYGSLEALLARAGEIKQPKRRDSLLAPENQEKARISKTLVTLVTDVAVEVPLENLVLEDPDGKRLVAFLKAMEFTTITRRAAEAFGVDAAAIDPDPTLAPGAPVGFQPPLAEPDSAVAPAAAAVPSGRPDVSEPSDLAAARALDARAAKVDRALYRTVTDLDELKAWCAQAVDQGFVAFDTETTGIDPQQADLVGISLALAPNRACYIPLAHVGAGDGLFSEGRLPGQIPFEAALDALRPMFEDKGTLKIGHNVKYDATILARYDIEVGPFDCTMCLSYALDAGRNNHAMDDLSVRHLGHQPIAFTEVAGKGKGQVTFDKVALEPATFYAAEDADVTLRLWRVLKPRLPADGMTTVYETLERPLIPVLARMESRGVSIDRAMLSRLSSEFAQGAARIEDEIAELAGERLNVGSPKQMGDILFGKMGLPGATKTPTGAWSTKANVLEELAEAGHKLPQKILEWRQLSKLRSTYTDALPSYVNPRTGRVHTCYALAATTTGRLSSSEPNLQNIPIRTEEGRRIRRAFVAAPGHLLVSADYSQIELRLLAEIAEIPSLRQAFQDGLDIHAMTASEMFGVPVEGMPSEVRRRAKAINFGIIYGISAFGLANQLGIPRDEAGLYIRRYFERFPGIRAYMDETKAFCREHGYVTTLFGRRCHYPDIAASNPSVRAFNERAAINARLQGTAADIIRRAMIRMDGALAQAKLSARMLLQVHDELVFEVPEAEVEATLPLVREVMEQACLPAVALAVPLKVDARAAANWDEAH
ncbi:DNA polymerase I [Aquabacter spiritensis]|uniref:DNA polymerase I n=1 Tax=Aquabacter spiritensis TaxID=933073 RepID=A0A4R3LY82_9HYPH|nr:DNA polymerase I [Aquabacter spiritensis]TCT05654.1 DNA polymerase I [Aquabacter spiritensis]